MFSPEERERIEATARHQFICARPEWMLEGLRLAMREPFFAGATQLVKDLDAHFLKQIHISPE